MSTAAEADLSETEREGLELIRTTGGIHQSDFWKELGVDSRKGSRIIDKLEELELAERSDAVYQGHNTYLVTPILDPSELDFSLLMAGDQLSPFVGDEDIDPQGDAFSQWVMTLAYEEY
ncbi:probable transcription factor (homolog to RNA polymerase III subunit RPC34) [Natronomonas moolapensis 8.8.11]|uniref:Probable transcription factor (Homolog to RNA polymerase III subunit RPC34) n=1 Tax=Natronomonas moolapensis (strain DSM 18674 / CECT 7526 / JCM 14361 / 8.8.11) TaxID=268739 RepID=M1Y3V7_NATM8|nr:MarR family transcriptional regulator [Natronomonas moolapensis]CCQ37211.1 probable transcription factor (homolog to RNA polymerase III subunit RPC34) [Natronomonas moolapensis 8.8.11]